jgi:signal transduction histidine kinase
MKEPSLVCEHIYSHSLALETIIRSEFGGATQLQKGSIINNNSGTAVSLLEHLYKDTSMQIKRFVPENGGIRKESDGIGGNITGKALERQLRDKIYDLDARHSMVIDSIADLKRASKCQHEVIEEVLKRQLRLMVAIQHAYHLTQAKHYHPTGCVHIDADLISVLKGARAQARSVADHAFNMCPEINIVNQENDAITDSMLLFPAFIPASLHFVVVELLKNAIHASMSKSLTAPSPVVVKVFDSDDEVCIEVSDKGTGMTEAGVNQSTQFLESATVSSQQLVNEQASYQPMSLILLKGFGAGLSLSNEYIRMHGGKLAIHSELGKGTDVRIHLPKDSTIEAI